MNKKIQIDSINLLAKNSGLELIGYLEEPKLEQDSIRLGKWQAAGNAAEMEYMLRSSELFSDPKNIFSEYKSILLFGISYSYAPLPICPQGFGRIARYAWGKDYHKVLKKCLKRFVNELVATTGIDPNFRIFSDSVPLLERALARQAGLGFVGKNTMLIKPGLGSYFFIAEILWDLELEGTKALELNASCGSCSKCAAVCPTGALDQAYKLDARKCISYLSIEKRGSLKIWERKALGEWLFGCDLCQEICPFNYKQLKQMRPASLREFEPEKGAGGILNLKELLQIRTDSEFLKRFAGTALMRSKRKGLLRNAAVVAANTDSVALMPILAEVFQSDSSDIIRQHALWSLVSLASRVNEKKWEQKAKYLLEQALKDSCDLIVKEAQFLLSGSNQQTLAI